MNREQLVISHLHLVDRAVLYHRARLPFFVDRGDLVSVAAIGLIQAADRFDPERGATFSTFAFRRVNGAIVDYMRGQLHYTKRQHRRLEARRRVLFNSDLVRDRAPNYLPDFDDPFVAARVRRAVSRLPRRERLVIVWRFWRDLLQADCGLQLGVKDSRVSAIQARAFERLRELLEGVRQFPGGSRS